jgi:cell division protein FtsN
VERLERGANRATLTTALPSPAPVVMAPAPVNKKTALLPRPLPAAAPMSMSTKTALAAKTTPPQAVSVPAKATTVALASKPAAKPPVAASHADKDKQKANFLLQLSSFQDRAEADAFARRFSAQNAYVVASEVPGKGLWYRVRVGSYGNLKDATVAKSAFEREHGVIAYVAGNGPAQ